MRDPDRWTKDKGEVAQLALNGGKASPNTGGLWLNVPFPPELVRVDARLNLLSS